MASRSLVDLRLFGSPVRLYEISLIMNTLVNTIHMADSQGEEERSGMGRHWSTAATIYGCTLRLLVLSIVNKTERT